MRALRLAWTAPEAAFIEHDIPRPKPGTYEAAKSHVTKTKKSYGARDRKALDNLIQATGSGD